MQELFEPGKLKRTFYLLCDLCGDGDAGLADEGAEEAPDRAQVLDVDRAQLRHRSLLTVKVVLPLLFQGEGRGSISQIQIVRR